MSDGARRAGRALGHRRRAAADTADPYAPELDWPAWRRQILAYGGIGPSKDWDREDIPGDLYRENGKPPDLVAAEAVRSAPWGSNGDDDAMIRQLKRAHREYQDNPERRHSIADPELAARRRSLKEGRDTELRRQYGTVGRGAHEAAAHNARMADFIAQVRAARARAPKQPAIGFYTDRKDVVHPIVAKRAGRAYALRRGK